ncbi:MAG: hypothetical protein ABJB05_13925 [Parafilimonas sp.]
MKSIKSKTLILGLSLFAFSAIHAQDTTKTPKPDTTQAPKADTTKAPGATTMVNFNSSDNASATFCTATFVMINENKLAAKLEANDDKRIA